MRMKASEVSDWLRQIVGKRDRREVVPDDNDLVLRLVVEPQQVVLGKSEAADGRF